MRVDLEIAAVHHRPTGVSTPDQNPQVWNGIGKAEGQVAQWQNGINIRQGTALPSRESRVHAACAQPRQAQAAEAIDACSL